MIENNIVEPSFSEYNCPILLVPKKSLPGWNEKRWRLVTDHRQINKKIISHNFPLPRIDDILEQLGWRLERLKVVFNKQWFIQIY